MFKTIFQTGLVGSFILLSGCGGGGSDSGGGEQDVNLASECIATPAVGSDFIRAQNTCDFARPCQFDQPGQRWAFTHFLPAFGCGVQSWLDDALITVNKNAIPFDDKSPFVTSGIRLGSSAVTTRGFEEDDMHFVADKIDEVLSSPGDAALHQRVENEIKEKMQEYPLFAKTQVEG